MSCSVAKPSMPDTSLVRKMSYLKMKQNIVHSFDPSKKDLKTTGHVFSASKIRMEWNAPQNYVISRPNPISVMLRMDIPLIRKTSPSIFYGEA